MCDNKSHEQLEQVVSALLKRLNTLENQVNQLPDFERRQANIIKLAVEQDRKIRRPVLTKKKR